MDAQEGKELEDYSIKGVIMYGRRYGYTFLNENKIYTLADLRDQLLKDSKNFSLV